MDSSAGRGTAANRGRTVTMFGAVGGRMAGAVLLLLEAVAGELQGAAVFGAARTT